MPVNNSTIDYDLAHHCICCSKNMRIERIVNQRPISMFTPDHCEVEFLLDDKSKMRVCMCVGCRDKMTDEDIPKIMKKVWRGWEEEVKNISHWDQEKKDNYLAEYASREIVTISTDKPKDHLEKEHAEFIESKKDKK